MEDQEFDFDFLFEFNQSDEGAVAAPAGGCATGRGAGSGSGSGGAGLEARPAPAPLPGAPPRRPRQAAVPTTQTRNVRLPSCALWSSSTSALSHSKLQTVQEALLSVLRAQGSPLPREGRGPHAQRWLATMVGRDPGVPPRLGLR